MYILQKKKKNFIDRKLSILVLIQETQKKSAKAFTFPLCFKQIVLEKKLQNYFLKKCLLIFQVM